MGHTVLWRPAMFVACLLAAFASISATSTHEQTATASRPRVDVLPNGNVVVSLDLAGELPGMVTLTFEATADGTATGQWAMVVAHADATDPETGEEPAEHEHVDGEPHAHKDFLRLIDRGAFGGVIESGTLEFNSDGVLTSMNATLTITQGTREFDGATGTGTATLSQITLVF